jgi:hypothetical protein
MLSDFTHDFADPDRPIAEALRERPGRAVRLRLQPQVLRDVPTNKRQYRAWKDVCWTLDVESVEEASALREALRAFFAAASHSGLDRVTTMLKVLAPPVTNHTATKEHIA